MIRLTHDTPIVLGVAPADFRCGVDGFAARTRELLGRDPTDGTLYVYTNRARTMIRGLAYDGTGFWLLTKRLSRGRFGGWPSGEAPMTAASARALRALLDGGPWAPATSPSMGTSAARSMDSSEAASAPRRPWMSGTRTPC